MEKRVLFCKKMLDDNEQFMDVNTSKPNSETYKIRPAWQDKTPNINHTSSRYRGHALSIQLKSMNVAKPINLDELRDAVSNYWTTVMTPETCSAYTATIFKIIRDVIAEDGKNIKE
uniref:Integrase_SAM-like_N domain-containing protein n=1 Tax=Heterorhabditis bacteriophora TaxID=37862 RepID=A0A1I7W7N7_HETBA